ncbi:MAG TPA: hypothetical protein VGL22_06660 [Terracidiphilus sp.]
MTHGTSELESAFTTIKSTYSRVYSSLSEIDNTRERVLETLARIVTSREMIRSSDSLLKRDSPRDL